MPRFLLILCLSVLTLNFSYSKESIGSKLPSGSFRSATNECEPSTSSEVLDINNVRTLILNGGDMWWNIFGDRQARYEIPKNDDPNVPKKHSLFAGSIWLGGTDQITGNLLVIANTYRQTHYSLWPGPLYEQAPRINKEICAIWDRHFKLELETIEEYVALWEQDKIITESDVPDEILYWPAKGNPYIQDVNGMEDADMNRALAPFEETFDPTPDGNYDPLEGDVPRIFGDQAIWYVMNDEGGVKVFGNQAGQANSAPIGMEIQSMAFAFATSDALNDKTFYWNRLLNRGNNILIGTHMAQWVDPDLGFSGDDFVEVDVPRGLGICYNGDDFDETVNGYGENPPSIGVDYFEGPWADLDTIGNGQDDDNDGLVDENDGLFRPDLPVYEGDGVDNDKDCVVDEPDELIIMSNFVYYDNTADQVKGNPGNAQDFFNYMRSIWRDNSLCTYDLKDGTDQTFSPVNFMFPGTSDLEIGWGFGGTCINPYIGSDNLPWDETIAGNVPGDRRMLQSAGPFTLRPGAVNELTIGIPWARTGTGGARGSFAKLLIADDQCQELFERNFQLKSGPNAPDVAVTELDREIILSISPVDFTIENQGVREQMNTETYREYEPKSNSFYHFQGYKFYQLIDGAASAADLDNENKARLIAQCDVVDGVTRIINYENDITLGPDVFVPKVKTEALDNGIFRTLSITEDAFAEQERGLVNHKTYYYMVVAYGYNEEEDLLNNSPLVIDRRGTPFLQGRRNVMSYVAIPHIPVGSVINSDYGDNFEITQIHGSGNGGSLLELGSELEESILSGQEFQLSYRSGNGPIDVKVFDPRRLADIDRYTVRLSSRLVYQRDNTIQFFPGDTLESVGNYNIASIAPPSGQEAKINPWVKQTNGKAIVIREIEDLATDTSQVLEVKLLNGKDGGRFTKELLFTRGDEDDVVGYDEERVPFRVVGSDAAVSGMAIGFMANDFWTLEADGIMEKSKRPISSGGEEAIPEIGISLTLKPGRNPAYRPSDVLTNPDNGLIEGTMEFEDPTNEWLLPVDLGSVEWLSEYYALEELAGDPNRVYFGVLNSSQNNLGAFGNQTFSGGAAPYIFGVKNLGVGAPSPYVEPLVVNVEQDKILRQSMSAMGNIDVVITPDRPDLWTRVAVAQFDAPSNAGRPAYRYRSSKSEVPSVDKSGNPDNSLDFKGEQSKGWSWFPGYAIDMDRGVRLHMWLAEDKVADPVRGDDLLWNPDSSENGLRHFIMLTNRQYDFDENGGNSDYQNEVDSLFSIVPVPNTDQYSLWYAQNFGWMLHLRMNPLNSILGTEPEGDVRIRLRVERAYEDALNGTAPEYNFDSRGIGVVENDPNQGQKHLDVIRVVPNPYYAYSQYENSQVDKRVKIANIPAKCKVSIFSVSGSLIRQFNVDVAEDIPGEGLTSIDWELTNADGLPIASGIYIVHVDGGDLGEKVVKFFNISRPIDLDSF